MRLKEILTALRPTLQRDSLRGNPLRLHGVNQNALVSIQQNAVKAGLRLKTSCIQHPSVKIFSQIQTIGS